MPGACGRVCAHFAGTGWDSSLASVVPASWASTTPGTVRVGSVRSSPKTRGWMLWSSFGDTTCQLEHLVHHWWSQPDSTGRRTWPWDALCTRR
jgi:hypothetical protein